MKEILITVLLLSGVGIELLCCIGIGVGRNPYARLHYLGPASVIGPLLIAVAVFVQESLFSSGGVKTILILLFLILTGPVLTHATARVAYLRETQSAAGGKGMP